MPKVYYIINQKFISLWEICYKHYTQDMDEYMIYSGFTIIKHFTKWKTVRFQDHKTLTNLMYKVRYYNYVSRTNRFPQ